jgi:Domain of unknown function (DUF4158)
MPSLERTAYPRFARVITAQELERAYTPSQEELTWARGTVRTPNHLLCLGILLKSFQRLHYFPDLDAVPEVVVNHIRASVRMLAKTSHRAFVSHLFKKLDLSHQAFGSV